MSIKCGSCKGSHETVREVRKCSGAYVPPTTKQRHAHGLKAPATPRQVSLAHALGRERERLAEHEGLSKADYEEVITKMGFTEVSTFISDMLKRPYVRGTGGAWDDSFDSILPGKYALRGDDGAVRFYRLGRLIDDGRGNKRIPVDELIGAPGEFRRRRILRSYKVLEAIAADPMAAFALFGQEVGRCGVCSSPLTQEHTRERGIGDICFDKMQAS